LACGGAQSLAQLLGAVEHFQEKWNPVFRPKMRQCKDDGAVSVSGLVKSLWTKALEFLV
jgi:hypothetical protein